MSAPTPTPESGGDLDRIARERMDQWRRQGLVRVPATFASAQTPTASIDGRQQLLFSSSNYLSLAEEPAVIEAATAALRTWGTSASGSRLTTGTSAEHRALERELAEFFGSPDAVFFATGYNANISTIQALVGTGALRTELTIFSDSLNHASLIDGIRLSGANCVVFPHSDMQALETALQQRTTPGALVISDAVFSMDGDICRYHSLLEITRRQGAWLYLDDAHGVGCLGETGRGIVEWSGESTLRPEIVVGTASKALGAEGGFVLCSAAVGTMLRNQARSFVFSTASPPATIASVRAALRVLGDQPERVSRLHRNIRTLGELLAGAGIRSQRPETPIVPIRIGDEAQAMELAAALHREGFFVPAIRYPTVPRGQALLRVTVMAHHTTEQLTALVDTLVRAMRQQSTAPNACGGA